MSGHGGHEAHDANDHFGKYVGIATAMLGLAVMITTILGHKSHTLHISKQSESYNTWSQYQAKKGRQAIYETQCDFAEAQDAEKNAAVIKKYRAKIEKYNDKTGADELPSLFNRATEQMADSHVEHVKGDRLDLAEGLLEFGVILCSLYFLSKKKFFPLLGGAAAAAGLCMLGYAFLAPAPHEGAHADAHPPATAPAEIHAPPGH